jgi:alpha-beta hydrolase superfamily lysophospholipase
MDAPTIEQFGPLPTALLARARWERLAGGRIPALIVHPGFTAETARGAEAASVNAVPLVLWMHGRTVQKEIDPGRFLRWMRAGIGVCAVDLPGHGERFEAELQQPERTFDVVLQMIGEIDAIVAEMVGRPEFDGDRVAIGGMSAGGMSALARLCAPHPFVCASVEATTGSWNFQRTRRMFRDRDDDEISMHDPIANLAGWRQIPVQAFHSRRDEWVAFDGQRAFIEALRERYTDDGIIDFVVYEETGAPYEHAGFGRLAADAKDRQRTFLHRWLVGSD